jgi:hypothetical protein
MDWFNFVLQRVVALTETLSQLFRATHFCMNPFNDDRKIKRIYFTVTPGFRKNYWHHVVCLHIDKLNTTKVYIKFEM